MTRVVSCICRSCGASRRVSGGNQHFKCKRCSSKKSKEAILQAKAHSAISCAIAKGVMVPAKSKNCVDCGERAREYDHREYAKPLEVDPVCRRCNILRGPAIDSPVKTNRFIKAAAKFAETARAGHPNPMVNEWLELAGGVRNLALALGVTTQAVAKWGRKVPDKRIAQVQAAHPEWFK